MAVIKIKRYAIHVVPSKNEWWLSLELEDGSMPGGIRVGSAADLAGLVELLRHAREPVFYPDTGVIETIYVPPGELAPKQANDSAESKFVGVLPNTGDDSQ